MNTNIFEMIERENIVSVEVVFDNTASVLINSKLLGNSPSINTLLSLKLLLSSLEIVELYVFLLQLPHPHKLKTHNAPHNTNNNLFFIYKSLLIYLKLTTYHLCLYLTI